MHIILKESVSMKKSVKSLFLCVLGVVAVSVLVGKTNVYAVADNEENSYTVIIDEELTPEGKEVVLDNGNRLVFDTDNQEIIEHAIRNYENDLKTKDMSKWQMVKWQTIRQHSGHNYYGPYRTYHHSTVKIYNNAGKCIGWIQYHYCNEPKRCNALITNAV